MARTLRSSASALVAALATGALGVVALGAAGAAPAGAAPAGALEAPQWYTDAAMEAAFTARINGLRASQGLDALAPNGALRATSCQWAGVPWDAGRLSHDPGLGEAAASTDHDWARIEENVGEGGDVAGLLDAFAASPAHYRNLVDPIVTDAGVCVLSDGRRVVTVQRFLAHAATAAPVATAAPAPAPTRAATALPAPAGDAGPGEARGVARSPRPLWCEGPFDVPRPVGRGPALAC